MDISISIDAYPAYLYPLNIHKARTQIYPFAVGLLLIPVYRNVRTPEMAQIYSLSQQRWPSPVPLIYFGLA